MARSVFDPHFGEQEPIYIPVTKDLIVGAFEHAMLNSRNGFEEVVDMIVRLDLMCQDWGVTEKLIAHFKALELEMMKEEECEPVEPKKIEP